MARPCPAIYANGWRVRHSILELTEQQLADLERTLQVRRPEPGRERVAWLKRLRGAGDIGASLWRYLKDGVIFDGAQFKAGTKPDGISLDKG